jgi:hypothetical protein
MRVKHFLIFFGVSFLIIDFASAQQLPVKTDSTLIYRNIESFSKRSKFTTAMYRMVFRPVAIVAKKKAYKKLVQKPYSTFEGKIIRNINITTLDPFGYSVIDTSFSAKGSFLKGANRLHIKTQPIAIRNLLLIRKNEPFISFSVKESERLIRTQKYVHDVYFYVASPGNKSDSVDIFIRELDRWSLIPKGAGSSSGMYGSITDQNFIGLGHEFRIDFTRNFITGINAFKTNYSIPNIRNSYINTNLHYELDGLRNFQRSIAFDRPFYSPFAKWAAGASFASEFQNDSLKNPYSIYVPVRLRFRTQDYWAGKATRIFKGLTEAELALNLITTLRYLHVRYTERPSEILDPSHYYTSEDFVLAGIGISSRRYVQDRYIYNHGVIEDVPVGKVYGITGGYQIKNNSARLYLGMRYSSGSYNPWGYLSSNFEYGTFFHGSHAEQGTFSAGINYFTGLFEIGKWKFREFIKNQVTIGINRFLLDSLTLNEGYGLDGFQSPSLSGTNRLILTLQTQSYAPWNLLGFRIGPYLTYSIGMLGEAQTRFKNSKVYSQIGLGVLIKNENLVFSSFQFSISFYPMIPGFGKDIFKLNSFRTTDLGFRDFELGKPGPVIFQ